MRQRDATERRALARLHRGEPDSYLRLKQERGQLDVFSGKQPGEEAERRLVARWAAAAIEYGESQAVMICRDNRRRERLNELARDCLREQRALGEEVEVAGRTWAVGERVIARRNDRSRDLDNGMRGTIIALDEHHGATLRLDSGATRRLDPEYLAGHVDHAYVLTGHGMQGATVEWAGVIGQPGDFSRNWSYTALSRAREPVEVFVVDEPGRADEEREEIAPVHRQRAHLPIERMAARMRERDDEHLALEQLEPSGQERDVSSARERIYELERQLDAIRAERKRLRSKRPTPSTSSIRRSRRSNNRTSAIAGREDGGTAVRTRRASVSATVTLARYTRGERSCSSERATRAPCATAPTSCAARR
jgi:hypothetical protein